LEGSIVRVEEKTPPKKTGREVKGQQPKKVDCGTMLVNTGSGTG